MMDVVVTTAAIRRAKLQSIVTTHKPTPSFLQAGCHSCRPTNGVGALKGEEIVITKNMNGSEPVALLDVLLKRLTKDF